MATSWPPSWGKRPYLKRCRTQSSSLWYRSCLSHTPISRAPPRSVWCAGVMPISSGVFSGRSWLLVLLVGETKEGQQFGVFSILCLRTVGLMAVTRRHQIIALLYFLPTSRRPWSRYSAHRATAAPTTAHGLAYIDVLFAVPDRSTLH